MIRIPCLYVSYRIPNSRWMVCIYLRALIIEDCKELLFDANSTPLLLTLLFDARLDASIGYEQTRFSWKTTTTNNFPFGQENTRP